MIRFLKTALVLSLLVAGAVVYVKISVDGFMDTPMQIAEPGLAFEIAPGSSFASVTSALIDAGAIDDDRWFRLYARYNELAGAIHAGDYLLPAGATPRQVLQQFVRGSVRLYDFTIVEGWNHRELLAALHTHPAINAGMSEDDWPDLLTSLGSESLHPEGLFLPETYRFPRNTTDRELLTQAYEHMQQVLAEEWPTRAADAPVSTPYEALTLASIIEKETARADERPKIAGVFARRLTLRMRLQTDPTVIYGIGPGFDGNLTRDDLSRDTPYNTYTRHGLPPTPIAMPGRDAIRAALNPENGTELYFVATALGDGSHTFSTTKDEHDAAVAEYLKRLRQNRGTER